MRRRELVEWVGGSGEGEVLAVRGDVVVVKVGDVVVKVHEVGTDVDGLAARVRVAAAVGGLLLPPVLGPAVVRGRVVTAWPLGTPVSSDGALPMEEAGRLLAALHRVRVPGPVPPARAWSRVERAVRDVPDVVGADVVLRAFATLGPDRGGDVLVHGDWHLGQLVWRDGWRLIDVDDIGVGDPAWDLARPAALFAAGVLEPGVWSRLLDAYLDAGGVAVRRDDPWEGLERPARALVVQMAARALTAAERDGKALTEAQGALLDACGRIVAGWAGGGLGG
ncbi:phosphotransferase [Saccharothrix sp. SC076]|nr:phosphotransferase [Saccharothrix obliqua]